jgi:hypothetical protein
MRQRGRKPRYEPQHHQRCVAERNGARLVGGLPTRQQRASPQQPEQTFDRAADAEDRSNDLSAIRERALRDGATRPA